MSDSDENAFASADEGEEKTQAREAAKQTPVKKEKAETGAGEAKNPKSPSKMESGKGKGKQQQRNKKGKNSKASASQEDVKKEETKAPESQKAEETSSKSANTEGGTDSGSKTKTASEEPEKSISPDQPAEVSSASPCKDKDQNEGSLGSEKKDVEASAGEAEAKPSTGSSVKSPEEQTIAASDRDHHTPQQEKVLHKLEESAGAGKSGWGWSSWGSSLLSAASSSVQTFTNQVGDGLNTIMDTVESSLGVPDPKDLAERNSEKDAKSSEPAEKGDGQVDKKKDETDLPKDNKEAPAKAEGQEMNSDEKAKDTGQPTATGGDNSWFASWGVGDLAKKMQNTGKSLAAKGQTLMTEGFDAVEHLAAGGIDVLENIGKKTYNTLAEHDPALRRTRQFLSPRGDKPTLSSSLREARDQAEQQQKQEEATQEALKAHFGTLFDDYQGLAHLEALEILSNQSEKKVHSLLNSLASEDLSTIKPRLMSIKNAFELDDSAEDAADDQDFTSLVRRHLSELELGTAPDKLNTVHQMVQAWIEDFDASDSNHSQGTKETHEKSIQALAELTAKGVEQFHKAGEMVLLDKDKDKDCTERAHSLARLTGVLCHEIGNLSNKFVACLNKLAGENKSEDVTSMVTNIYLEASNSSTYIQDAFLLLLPVLQHAALEQAILALTLS
ncbi:hypothetical protein EGW08_004966 [Elysia chlorotica]|uniref:Protein FAM114A2 n=1 Tax=Elysia chlorotica TaxID=188477 RepID=A0A433U0E4_ELYCH|nr:hypothetical protein EGW08_004966 [Elysia chlorotica]